MKTYYPYGIAQMVGTGNTITARTAKNARGNLDPVTRVEIYYFCAGLYDMSHNFMPKNSGQNKIALA
jgi:hypothetical protein